MKDKPMTHDETIQHWALQWVTTGAIPDLPADVDLVAVQQGAKHFRIPLAVYIDMRPFAVDHGETVSVCHLAYLDDGKTKRFVVSTPTVVLRWLYDDSRHPIDAKAEAQP